MGTVGALGVVALGAVDLFGAPTGAQSAEALVEAIAVDGSVLDTEQRIDDSGRIVVFESTRVLDSGAEFTQVLMHDRSTGATQPVPESSPAAAEPVQTFNPAISANGCTVTYSTFTDAVFDVGEAPDVPADGDEAPADGDDAPADGDDAPADGDDVPADGDASESPASTDVPPSTVEPELSLPDTAEPTVVVTPAASQLRAVDRCASAAPTTSVLVASEEVESPLPAAAVSSDGVFVAYSTGDAIVRMQGTVSGYTLTSVFDTTLVPSATSVVGPRLDISADGSVIVFEAGVDTTPTDSTDVVALGVHAWTAGDGPTPPAVRPVASLSTHPSVSADGSVIAFESQVGSDSAFSGVVIQLVSAEGAIVNISVDALGSEPDVSADGRHVVYNTTAGRSSPGLAMTSSVGDGTSPFAGVDVTDLGAPVAGSPALSAAASGPRVGAFGDVVAVDPTSTPTFATQVVVRSLPASVALDQSQYDLGSAERGEVLTTPVTVTNQGPSSLVLGDDAVVVESPFTVADNGCSEAIGPRATCIVEVSVELVTLEDIAGSISVTPPGGPTVTAELVALVAAPSTEGASTVTTTPANTTATTIRVTPETTRTTTRVTTPITTSAPVTTRAPVVEIDLDPIFEPTSFEFAPTIVDAGVRTASLEIINPGSSTETLSAVDVADDAAGFAVVANDCAELSVGSRCTVDLVFAPVSEGSLSTDLVATFASGARATSTLSGIGAPAPTLAVIPGVATVGQVVTVQGAGFPAGSTVDVTFGDGVVEREVVVNDVGVFNLPLVVLPHTQAGPLTVVVAGQDEAFGETTTEMLVTSTTGRTSPALLGSFGANVSR